MKWLPSVITVLGTLAAVNADGINHYVSGHPAAAIGIAGAYAIIKNLLPSPLTPTNPPAGPQQ